MNNGYNIEWSDQATLDFEEIVQFLFNIWGETIVRKFVRSVDNELIRISTFPYAFPASSLKIPTSLRKELPGFLFPECSFGNIMVLTFKQTSS